MAQTQPDHNFHHTAQATQRPLPAQFRNPFEMLFDERTGALNYDYIKPYIPKSNVEVASGEESYNSLAIHTPRRSRTTFTNAQVAMLEQYFDESRYLTATRLAELSEKLYLRSAQVKIWFKNRRRRYKILADLCKKEARGGKHALTSSPQKKRAAISKKSLKRKSKKQTSTSNLLTPSPTPTVPAMIAAVTAAHTGEHFQSADTYNPYYFNHQHSSFPTAHAQIHGQQPNTQAFNPSPHNYQHNYATNSLFANSQLHQLQPQTLAQQSAYYSSGMKHPVADHNFNNAFYLGKPMDAAPPAADSTIPSDRLSTINDIYEPLTPKNDEPASIGDKMFHTLEPKKLYDEPTYCTGSMFPFASKQERPTMNPMSSSEVNLQCSMDTLMYAYNNHRNTNNNINFPTYCFN